MKAIQWNATPNTRGYQVFDANKVACGCWIEHGCGRAFPHSKERALAKMREVGGHIIVFDEYTAKLPYLGHVQRVAVGRIDSHSARVTA